MKKEDLKITLDELNTIIPIFAHEFCDENVGENDKVMRILKEMRKQYSIQNPVN